MWEYLTEDEKNEYQTVCDKLFGKTPVKVENGQPLYFDTEHYMINTEPLMILIIRKNKVKKILNKINHETKTSPNTR